MWRGIGFFSSCYFAFLTGGDLLFSSCYGANYQEVARKLSGGGAQMIRQGRVGSFLAMGGNESLMSISHYTTIAAIL
jgi:hypothetical protein